LIRPRRRERNIGGQLQVNTDFSDINGEGMVEELEPCTGGFSTPKNNRCGPFIGASSMNNNMN